MGLAGHARATRSRVLTDAKLQCIWRACGQRTAFDDEACGGFQTTMPDIVTMPRPFAAIVPASHTHGATQGRDCRAADRLLSNDACTLPSTLTKNGREHSLPLGSFAISIVSALTQGSQSGLLFPTRGAQSAFNGWSKSKAALDKLSGVSDWTLHDLRRTFATRLAELGVAPHVIEAILNHQSGVISPLARIYNRHTWLNEMRDAIEKWEARLRVRVGDVTS